MSKISIVTASMIRGGAERVISLLANHFAGTGHEVEIVMITNKKVEYQLDKGVSTVDLSFPGIGGVKRIFCWIKGIRKYYRTSKPDLIISFSAQVNITAYFSLFGLRKNFVTGEISDPTATVTQKSKVIRLMSEYVYAHSDNVIFQTQRVMNYFGKKARSKGIVINQPAAVECEAEAEKKKRIVNVGRLVPDKNQKMLIKAFYQISQKHPDFILEFFGDGIYRDELTQYARELGISDRVILNPSVPDIHDKIKDAYMFVLSSNAEGLSNALLEAMMMGHAVISTECAGSVDMIKNNENGLLVPVGDCEALADAMDFMIENPEKAAIFGENAKESVKMYRQENVFAAWDEFVDKWLK